MTNEHDRMSATITARTSRGIPEPWEWSRPAGEDRPLPQLSWWPLLM